ncbi:MAG: helix-turn-helix domain-containing protein [Iamia sp.]
MPDDLLTELGIDLNDPEVVAARADAAELGNLIESLVRLRGELGLRQKDLARIIGTTQSAVSDFERIGGDPRLTTVQRYARALGARVSLAVDVSRCDEGPWRTSSSPPVGLEGTPQG